MSDKNLEGAEALKKLSEIVKEVKNCMMCTITEENSIHSRPMSTAQIEEDGSIWFFTRRSSEKVEEIESDKGVCLCYSEPKDNTYACIMSIARIKDDEAKKKELWNPLLKAWFPQGLDDPELTLIKCTPYHGEYWDSNDSRMITFLKIAKAAITGGTYGEGNHGEMKL